MLIQFKTSKSIVLSMKIIKWKYLTVYITPLVVIFSLLKTNYWSYFALFFIFMIIPLFELFTNKNDYNLSKIEEEIAAKDSLYDWVLYGLVPLQYGILIFFLFQVSSDNYDTATKIGWTTAYGIACGVLGINAAHELGHRNTNKERTMSKMLLLTSLYMHFYIEHNRGHHQNVATNEDPASSKLGETVYAFYIRSIFKGWLSAWRLEANRLKIVKKSFWSSQNQMLGFQIVQLLLLLLIFGIFGLSTMVYFLAGAFIGILLLETVNYIEHYGLRRNKKGERYERTLPIHSWNSNHPIGRLLLLELSRHSDHHYIASRKYQLLRHHEESPQMPTGYPGMMLLSFVPPLWFYIMHDQLQKFTIRTE